MNDPFTAEAVYRYAPTAAGRPIEIHRVIDSTNTRARTWGEAGVPHGAIVAAASQTAGRGRRGRSFHSPDGTGLYFSILLRPDFAAEHAVRITTAAAVALCRALTSLGVPDARIKWVNDIFRGERKIAGILTEGAFTSDGRFRYAVLGVGVNVLPPPGGFPAELQTIAGSAFDAPDPACPDLRARLLAAFLEAFFPLYDRLDAPIAPHMAEYRRLCFLAGRSVTVRPTGGRTPYSADVLDIDDECRLLIRLADGSVSTLASGEVSLTI